MHIKQDTHKNATQTKMREWTNENRAIIFQWLGKDSSRGVGLITFVESGNIINFVTYELKEMPILKRSYARSHHFLNNGAKEKAILEGLAELEQIDRDPTFFNRKGGQLIDLVLEM